MRIIWGALLAGPTFFFVVIRFIVPPPPPNLDLQPILGYVALAMLAAAVSVADFGNRGSEVCTNVMLNRAMPSE